MHTSEAHYTILQRMNKILPLFFYIAVHVHVLTCTYVGTAVQDEMEADIRTPRGLPAFASGELLALPHNFE